MKTSIQVVLALAFTTAGALGQVGVVTNSGVSPTTQGGLLTSPYELVSAGPNNRVWRCETYETLPNGQVHTNTRSYQELRSGLNVQNGNGNWVAARPSIEIYSGGAIARHAQHQVIFANNLNTAGAIDVQAPDGVRLRSTVMGLMYSDAASGQAVQIAALQDSEGELVADHDNEVLYPSALVDTNTGVMADVLYENRLDGMDQSIVLKTQLPDPKVVYGMNPATTYLSVL